MPLRYNEQKKLSISSKWQIKCQLYTIELYLIDTFFCQLLLLNWQLFLSVIAKWHLFLSTIGNWQVFLSITTNWQFCLSVTAKWFFLSIMRIWYLFCMEKILSGPSTLSYKLKNMNCVLEKNANNTFHSNCQRLG